jgi:hypothetical protein
VFEQDLQYILLKILVQDLLQNKMMEDRQINVALLSFEQFLFVAMLPMS